MNDTSGMRDLRFPPALFPEASRGSLNILPIAPSAAVANCLGMLRYGATSTFNAGAREPRSSL
eukprot:14628875-Alexandrium_andersonii.AAC.1